jgi:hypothetical protein
VELIRPWIRWFGATENFRRLHDRLTVVPYGPLHVLCGRGERGGRRIVRRARGRLRGGRGWGRIGACSGRWRSSVLGSRVRCGRRTVVRHVTELLAHQAAHHPWPLIGVSEFLREDLIDLPEHLIGNLHRGPVACVNLTRAEELLGLLEHPRDGVDTCTRSLGVGVHRGPEVAA